MSTKPHVDEIYETLRVMSLQLFTHIYADADLPQESTEPKSEIQATTMQLMEEEKTKYTGDLKLYVYHRALAADFFVFILSVVNTKSYSTLYIKHVAILTDEPMGYKGVERELNKAWVSIQNNTGLDVCPDGAPSTYL